MQTMINFWKILRGSYVAISIDLLTKLFGFAKGAANQIVALKAENAELRDQIAVALSNDAADAESIATAKAESETAKVDADAAKAAVAPLQALANEDASEDEQVNVLLNSFEFPE